MILESDEVELIVQMARETLPPKMEEVFIKFVKSALKHDLDKPTALAFDSDGNLYITVIGPKAEGDNASKQGKLLKIGKEAKL